MSWNDYIRGLSDFPELISIWEVDMVNEIKNTVSKGRVKKTLEVGCSNGRWLRWFCKEYECEGVGVDISDVGFFKKDLHFTIGDAFKLPYQDNSFDVVFSLGLIEHFEKSARFLLLKEQSRVLKNNGFLICVVPNSIPSLEFIWVKYIYDYKQGFKHYNVTQKELIQNFEKLNLKIISRKFLGWFFERFTVPKLFRSAFTSNNYMIVGIKNESFSDNMHQK